MPCGAVSADGVGLGNQVRPGRVRYRGGSLSAMLPAHRRDERPSLPASVYRLSPRWRVQLLKFSMLLNAREIIPLNGCAGWKASTRLWITCRLSSFSSSLTWVRKRVFLPLLSRHGHLRLGKQDRQWNTRHAAAAANIEPAAVLDERHHAQTVEQMPRHHFVGIAHGGEVVGLVPFDQQGQITQQLRVLGFCQRSHRVGEHLWITLRRVAR